LVGLLLPCLSTSYASASRLRRSPAVHATRLGGRLGNTSSPLQT
jgi:hypothetical protein